MDLIRKFKLLMALISTGFLGNLLVIYFLSRGFSYAQIGLETSIGVLGAFLFEVPTGVVGDKISRKLSVLMGFSIHALGSVILLFLRNFPMLLLYALISSLGASFVSGSFEAWLFDDLKHIGREKEYRKVMRDAKSITIPLSATALIIGGFLAQFYGFILPIILSLVVELSAIVLILSIPEYEFKKTERDYLGHTLSSLRELFQPRLFWLILLSIVVSMQANQFRKFFEPYLGDILARSLGTTLMGTLGLLGVVEVTVRTVPRLVGVRLRDSWSRKAYSLAPILIPVFTVLSVVYPNPLWIVTLGIVLTILTAAFSFNLSVEFQHRIPSEKRATLLSLDRMIAGLMMALFYAVYGFAVDKLGLAEARLMFAVILLVVGASFKVGEVLGFLGEHLRLSHLEGSGN
ncbi:MFS transporter permease [Thermococcus profundus]|uniref:MFS transporter permease n=1 Tax=Thermococcus profundus TaxID=49899 RepID=A0A2Z2MJ55_THEPR|nr:MFS transporter [Thermococcus profundus]ASJ02461.1 MFS transporter permease [Thermococcus profundus]